ncbi:MAG TPA: rhodanese-like domain-containing protein [Leucothrix sp.]|nr:rhodanese-like domain-containing protein [Leucothrix sp.]
MFGVKEIDAAGLKEMMDSDENIQLLDVRSQAEFAQGIIEGGEFVPLHTVPLKVNDLSKDKTIVIYCRSGARSAQACMFLSQNTDIEAINLRGGIISWYQSGFDVVRPDEMQAQG